MKKETLEEAAEKWFGQDRFYPDPKQGFVDGAKWQQERMYSEEDINDMFDTLKQNSIDNAVTITNVDLFISSWKREFKKK